MEYVFSIFQWSRNAEIVFLSVNKARDWLSQLSCSHESAYQSLTPSLSYSETRRLGFERRLRLVLWNILTLLPYYLCLLRELIIYYIIRITDRKLCIRTDWYPRRHYVIMSEELILFSRLTWHRKVNLISSKIVWSCSSPLASFLSSSSSTRMDSESSSITSKLPLETQLL